MDSFRLLLLFHSRGHPKSTMMHQEIADASHTFPMFINNPRGQSRLILPRPEFEELRQMQGTVETPKNSNVEQGGVRDPIFRRF